MRRDKKIRIIIAIIGVIFLYSITNSIAAMLFNIRGIMVIITIAVMFAVYMIFSKNSKISLPGVSKLFYEWRKKRHFRQMEELRYYLKGKYGNTGKCPGCSEALTVFTVTLSRKCKNCGEKV